MQELRTTRHGADRGRGAKSPRSARRDRAADPAGARRNARRPRGGRSRGRAAALRRTRHRGGRRRAAQQRAAEPRRRMGAARHRNHQSAEREAQRAHHREPGRHRAGRSRARGRGRRLACGRHVEEAARRVAGAQLRDRRSQASDARQVLFESARRRRPRDRAVLLRGGPGRVAPSGAARKARGHSAPDRGRALRSAGDQPGARQVLRRAGRSGAASA